MTSSRETALAANEKQRPRTSFEHQLTSCTVSSALHSANLLELARRCSGQSKGIVTSSTLSSIIPYDRCLENAGISMPWRTRAQRYKP